MSKFLNIVENNLPPQDLDKKREALRELQQLFASKDITSSLKTFSDVVTITIGDKIINLELKNISKKIGEEDGEDDVVSGILNTDPLRLKRNPVALKARNDITAAVAKVAKKITTAANQSNTMSY